MDVTRACLVPIVFGDALFLEDRIEGETLKELQATEGRAFALLIVRKLI